jgi:hypothetical protein
MMNKTRLPFLRTENLVVKELPDELLIYDLEKNKAFCLNETARLIMDECDGQTSVDEAIEKINHKTKSKMSEEMIWMVVEQLQNANFIEKDYQIPLQTTRVTRRKILQSAAALGIALPMITSLVAPTALHAQSGCIGGEQPCASVEDESCCESLICVNIEAGPTGHICIGCTPLGNPCTIGQTTCCGGGICFAEEGVPICVSNIAR